MRTSNIVQKSQSSREVGENAIAMSIDEASSVFLMDALGKLYARPAQAALREYLSNAIDAHKAKGGKLPAIQITLPDSNGRTGSSKLFIRDFGKGMNESEFETILSRYGASTKRDSNAMIGGFGLGAKSGFAISDEFFMTSYQEGKGLRVRIFKDALNQGFIDVIDRFSTKEADGILVEVPIPSGNLYELSKKSLFSDFPFFMGYGVDAIDVKPAADFASQSVHNSKAFTTLEFGGEDIGWLAKKSVGKADMYALIGRVAYPLDLNKFSSLSKQDKTVDKTLVEAVNALKSFRKVKVINIPIGSVDLPSAREEITYSERSIRTIGAIITNYAMLMKQHVQKELNTKTTKLQALNHLADLEDTGYKGVSELTWKGANVGVEMFRSSATVFTALTHASRYGYGSSMETEISHTQGKTLKQYRELRNLSSKADYKYGFYRITVDSAAEIPAVKKLMTATVLRDFLKIDKDDSNRQRQTNKALFVITVKDDVLNDWVFNHTDLVVSELHKVVQKQKDEKVAKAKKAEEEKTKQEAAKQKAAKARETRAQSMLSNFIVNDSAGRSVTRNTVDTVFKYPDEILYYWSEEEVTEFANVTQGLKKIGDKEKTGLLFPFIATPMPNTFNAVTEGRSYSEVNYMTKLRSFLRLFFETGTKMIIVGKAWDLNEFQTTYPKVKSGVLAVKEAVESQLTDEHSAIMIAYNAIGDARFKDKSEVKNLLRFVKKLDETQKAGLNKELTSAVERFNVVMDSASINRLDDKYFMEALKGFATMEVIKEKSYSVGEDTSALTAKYPLLMNGNFSNYSPEVISHLLDYINMCDKK